MVPATHKACVDPPAARGTYLLGECDAKELGGYVSARRARLRLERGARPIESETVPARPKARPSAR
eukprot:1773284-Pleurochrysis_carterae.AAC.1